MGVFIGDGVPGTLYLPGKELARNDIFPEPKPAGQRPALVIMAHGYSSDQQGLSTMARSVARAGYATLTFDFRGHGANRHRFEGNIDQDLAAVIDWAQTSPYVDPARIAVLGHSMGAGAALDWSTLDKRVAAVIPVSGGDAPNDVYTPPHVLFIVAAGDPGQIHDGQAAAAAQLKQRPGTAVKSIEISKTDHLSVVSDGRTFDAITGFLDNAFGTPTDRLSTGRDDPRRATATAYAFVAVILFGFLGRLAGRAVPPLPTTTAPGAWILLAAASLLTLPLLATGGFSILPIGAGQQVAIATMFAAAVLWSARYFVRTGFVTGTVAEWVGDGEWLPWRSVGVPGVLAGLAIFVMLAPAGVVLHATVPNLERLVYWVILAAAMLPFFAPFEAIVRRGGTWAALGFGLLGRALLVGVLLIGLGIGALPGVLGLILIPLAVQYLVLEVFAAAAWSTGRNAALIAVVESIFVAWVAVMFSPIG
jgi:dienelactone hydrolase